MPLAQNNRRELAQMTQLEHKTGQRISRDARTDIIVSVGGSKAVIIKLTIDQQRVALLYSSLTGTPAHLYTAMRTRS